MGSPLPAGFTLDADSAQPAAGLPAGFTIDAPQQPQAPKQNSTLPANAGLAKLITSVAGLPVDTIENAINLIRAGGGALAQGAFGRTDLMPEPLEGSVGGSQWLQNQLRRTGEPGLSPDNPTPQSQAGTAQYDFVSRGGVIPGGAIPAAGSMIAEKIGGPEWAGVGALAPTAAISGFNKLRAPELKRQQQHHAVRDEGFEEFQQAGYKVPPSEVRPTFVGNRFESIAGKSALNQQAVDENQFITDALARKAAGLQEGAKITEGALAHRAHVLAEPYREVAALSPLAKSALQKLRDARAESRLQWQHYERQRVPEAQREAKRLDQQAETLERVIEREAQRHGKPDLVPQLREARQAIARVHDVQRALNRADGHVDPRDLHAAWERGAPLSGELLTIAKFTGAFKNSSRLSSANPTPGVSALEPTAAAGLGVAGSAAGAGWMPMGVPLLSAPTRAGLLSDTFQRGFVRPNYEPTFKPEPDLQSIARLAILQNQQERK